jgi:hypothetical protein
MTSHAWTTVARTSVALVLVGLAVRIAVGWKVGDYLAGAAFLALLVTLDKP